MPRPSLLALAALTLAAAPLAAQAPVAAGDTSVFAPLALYPSPSEFRLGSGAPGPRYWQNRADYRLAAALDTATHTLRGTMRLRYTNNSPVALPFIWMQTEQNAFRDSSLNSLVYPQNSRFGARGFHGGDVIESFAQLLGGGDGGSGGRAVPLALRDRGTVTQVQLAEPLQPGATATFDVAWHFQVPEHGADRMGRDGALYELAQWYPRVSVYDDVRGWNTDPYLGQGEFYLEYGDYDLSVTVPAGYIVAATGMLQNPREVLTPAEAQRLEAAKGSALPVPIVTAAELRSGAARPRTSGTLTWRFHAENVRDVAWAASPDYQWDAGSWNGALAMAYYRPEAADLWHDAADMARLSIQEYSERWFPYPWPQISAVEGPVSGMEYPMLAMESHGSDQEDLYYVITHEIGHDWFPMIVGSNERMHMWQDEGLNTFINPFSQARRFPGQDLGAREAELRQHVEAAHAAGLTLPVETPPDRIHPRQLASRLREAAVGLAAAARGDPGARGLRRGFPRLHPPLGVQAPHPGRLLPHHERRLGRAARLVLARVVPRG